MIASDWVAVPGPPFVSTNGRSKTPNACRMRNSTAIVRVGVSCGSTTRQNVCQVLAPSSSAAS
jgi:hypothetical protein